MTWSLILFSIFLLILLFNEQKREGKISKEYIITHTDQKLYDYIKERGLDKKPFFVLGNYPEYYYLFNQLPPVHMSIIFHDIYKPQFPNMEENLINEIVNKNISTIIAPYPIDPNYSLFIRLQKMIETEYQILKSSKTFLVCVQISK